MKEKFIALSGQGGHSGEKDVFLKELSTKQREKSVKYINEEKGKKKKEGRRGSSVC